MERKDDKKTPQQRQNSAFLQVSNAMQGNDNGHIPLVIVNDGAEVEEKEAGDQPVKRKRSRGISTVSMNSNSSVDVQEVAVETVR